MSKWRRVTNPSKLWYNHQQSRFIFNQSRTIWAWPTNPTNTLRDGVCLFTSIDFFPYLYFLHRTSVFDGFNITCMLELLSCHWFTCFQCLVAPGNAWISCKVGAPHWHYFLIALYTCIYKHKNQRPPKTPWLPCPQATTPSFTTTKSSVWFVSRYWLA